MIFRWFSAQKLFSFISSRLDWFFILCSPVCLHFWSLHPHSVSAEFPFARRTWTKSEKTVLNTILRMNTRIKKKPTHSPAQHWLIKDSQNKISERKKKSNKLLDDCQLTEKYVSTFAIFQYIYIYIYATHTILTLSVLCALFFFGASLPECETECYKNRSLIPIRFR